MVDRAVQRDDAGADREELDHVRTPAVAAFVNLRSNDALCSQADGLGLHTLHRQFARVVESLGIIGHLYVLANLFEPLSYALTGDMIDTVAHDHADGPVTGAQQGPEILAGEVGGEGQAANVAVGLTTTRADSGTDGDKLRQ